MGRFSHTFLLCSSRAIIGRLPTFRYYCLMHVYQKWQSRFFDRLRNTHPSWGGYFYGMPDRIRTCDLLITNQLLYQLSYTSLLTFL